MSTTVYFDSSSPVEDQKSQELLSRSLASSLLLNREDNMVDARKAMIKLMVNEALRKEVIFLFLKIIFIELVAVVIVLFCEDSVQDQVSRSFGYVQPSLVLPRIRHPLIERSKLRPILLVSTLRSTLLPVRPSNPVLLS
jgi:hypothetical protein